MLLDRFLPGPRFAERYELYVNASTELAWEAVEQVDLADDRVVATLLRLRGLGRPRSARLADFERHGFVRLATEPGRELVLGVVGRFWTPSGGVLSVEHEEFAAFDRPGYLKAAWNFRVEPSGPGALVSTETRVTPTDRKALLLFRPYWLVVRPFSGLIRRRMLAAVKAGAERPWKS